MKILFLIMILISAWPAFKIYGASARGHIYQKVVRTIAIANVSGINFGTSVPGDGAKTVDPGQSENAENGSFLVQGEPNSNYRIILPPDGAVILRTTLGFTSNRKIAVNQFRSFPSGTGTLSKMGEQLIFIGATRDALKQDQASGTYHGHFTVTAVY